MATIGQLVNRRLAFRMLLTPISTVNASLCLEKRTFTQIFYRDHCVGQAISPLWWISLPKDLQTESLKRKLLAV